MKQLVTFLSAALVSVVCHGQSVETALGRAEQEAQQRSADYLSGADVQRDILTYRARYDDDGFCGRSGNRAAPIR